MNALPAASAYPSPAPAFTVATALDWLGHQCTSRCSSSLDDLPAAIWFVRRRSRAKRRQTIVVVDLTDSGRIRRPGLSAEFATSTAVPAVTAFMSSGGASPTSGRLAHRDV